MPEGVEAEEAGESTKKIVREDMCVFLVVVMLCSDYYILVYTTRCPGLCHQRYRLTP